MSDHHRSQLYERLNTMETDALLEIWHHRDKTQWQETVFVIVGEILVERLGQQPPQPIALQVSEILSRVEGDIAQGEWGRALEGCERAIQLMPDSAPAYYFRGVILQSTRRFEDASASYQRAIELDPGFRKARENLRVIETELEGVFQADIQPEVELEPLPEVETGDEADLAEEFEGSPAKQRLDQALEYAISGELEQALEACEAARANLPHSATAYNYLGLIFQTLHQYEPAIQAYRLAIRRNPRFSAARQNLRSARASWEAEQYHLAAMRREAEDEEPLPEIADLEKMQTLQYVGPTPGWLYLDETAYWLRGWPGFRNRPGRSGLDPLDAYFEEPHTYGIIIRRLLNRRLRTHNPVYLLLMTFAGLICSSPVFMFLLSFEGDWFFAILSLIYSPLLIVGFALLLNVFLSLFTRPPEDSPSPFY